MGTNFLKVLANCIFKVVKEVSE